MNFVCGFLGDGSHPVYGHGEKAAQGHQENPVEAIAAPGEPNLGY